MSQLPPARTPAGESVVLIFGLELRIRAVQVPNQNEEAP